MDRKALLLVDENVADRQGIGEITCADWGSCTWAGIGCLRRG